MKTSNLLYKVRSDVEERYHAAIKNHFSTTTETDVARMRQNIASLANHASDLADEILTENKQQMQELTALLCSMSQAQERTIAKALRDTKCFRRSVAWAGQTRPPVQRRTTSSRPDFGFTSRTAFEPQTGQVTGKT